MSEVELTARVAEEAKTDRRSTSPGDFKRLSIKQRLFAIKSVEDLRDQAAHGGLKRSLGPIELTLIGIGEIVGAGIFVLTGTAAANYAGPAVALSFVVAAVASFFAALCYSELASIIPVAGSAYTYSYATLGSWVAFTIGWDLCLEYLVGAATVCASWSAYLQSLLSTFNVHVPHKFSGAPLRWDEKLGKFEPSGKWVDVCAMLLPLFLTAILVRGVKESSLFNNTAVAIKLTVIVVFIVVMAAQVNTDNWKPFIPPNQGEFGKFGVTGIFRGASVVFFAYIGFDAVSCCAQECRKPERDLPIGTLASLLICTALYIAVCFVATGLAPYSTLGVAHPISYAVAQVPGYGWLVTLIDIGALSGLTSVILVSLLSQPRVFHAMSTDGFLPPIFSKIHPTYRTPWLSTLLGGVVCSLLAGLMPIRILHELTSVGTLFAFSLVSLGVMILRIRRPNLERKFKVPLGPYVIPLLGVLSSLGLIASAEVDTIYRLFGWMAVGWLIYFTYGFWRANPLGPTIPSRSVIPSP